MRSEKFGLGVGWDTTNPTMPTTPKMFGTLHNGAVRLALPAERPAGSRLGFLLARVVDKLAPDGFEDDEGFHLEGIAGTSERRLPVAPSCRGEHI